MAYREETRRPVDLEIDALHDLLARIRRVRRQVALPALVAMVTAIALGVSAHRTAGAVEETAFRLTLQRAPRWGSIDGGRIMPTTARLARTMAR